MRVLVCGSRDWTDLLAIHRELAKLPAGTTVIQGTARGADTIAASTAAAMGFDVEDFPADWKAEPRRAGILRNLAMLDTRPDLVLAFQRNGSTGTQHTINEARRRGIPVEVYGPDPSTSRLPQHAEAQTAEPSPQPNQRGPA